MTGIGIDLEQKIFCIIQVGFKAVFLENVLCLELCLSESVHWTVAISGYLRCISFSSVLVSFFKVKTTACDVQRA